MDRLFDDPAQAATGRYAQVALEQGIDASAGGLTYSIPQSLADLRVGERVMVPLGRRDKSVPGFVLELADHSQINPDKLKSILARDSTDISLTPDLVTLAGWIAGYYCCPIGMVFANMLPAAVKRGTGRVSQVMVAVAEEGISDFGFRISDLKKVEGGETGPAAKGTDESVAASEQKPAGKVRLSKMQTAVLAAARGRAAAGERWLEIKALADLAGARSIAPVRQLVDKGLLIARHQEVVLAMHGGVPDSPAEDQRDKPLILNDDQKVAVDRVVQSIHAGFSVHLLHGITGSGKTEVYLRVLEEVLKGELSPPPNPKSEIPNPKFLPGAIVLVPEIALTPQTVARFVSRFDGVAVMHSGLSAAQRHEQWRRIRTGEARIVVGARSAVFAPLPNLKLIIVDEEHEHSYKQDQLPRYQARDVAIKRAQLLNIPVLLGSATPSLESYYNARPDPGPGSTPAVAVGFPNASGLPESRAALRGLQAAANHETSSKSEIRNSKSEIPPPSPRKNYHLHTLPQRIAGLTLPKVEIVDMNEERRKRYEYSGSAGVHLLSVRLEKVIQQALDAKGQVILLLNRRGYANYIACPDHRCGWMMTCELCDATMVYHKDAALPLGGLVRCHHCTAEQLLPPYCPTCGKKVTVFGLGTQRVEEEIAKKFPAARVLRMDSDVMRTARDYQRSLESFRSAQVDVLVGTQMIAKGLDFPNVHVVGVISADTALNMPDFRAGERTFQLISQVAGRAGRGGVDNPGRVIVQSFSPQDPAIVLAAAHDYEAFAQRELELRRQVGLPPVTRMARIVVRDQDHVACFEQATKIADALAGFNATLGNPVRLRGPSPCPIGRIAGYFRQQIEMIAPDAATIQKLLTGVRNARLLHADARTAVDVDPVALM